MVQQTEETTQLRTELQGKKLQICNLVAQSVEQDQQLVKLEKQSTDSKKRLQEHEEKIKTLTLQVSARDQQMREMTSELTEKSLQITQLLSKSQKKMEPVKGLLITLNSKSTVCARHSPHLNRPSDAHGAHCKLWATFTPT